VTLALAKFNRILSIDATARTARCSGVRNLAISEAAAPLGLYYAPDPSSQIACTIGGNVAENSGGVHCLKYGLTVHNVLQVRGSRSRARCWSFGQRGARQRRAGPAAVMVGQRGHAGGGHRGDREAGAPSHCWRAASWPASTT
jgi:glycolate oxidase